MDINSAIKILEALAAGCSPTTGEIIPNESVLNERNVIRALQIAIDNLKKGAPANDGGVGICEEDINTAITLFLEHESTPTENRLTDFFMGTRAFKTTALVSHSLYGKYRTQYTKGQLHDFFADYLSKRGYLQHGKNGNGKRTNAPWANIDFFQKAVFNNLTATDIDILKEKVNEFGVTKQDNLADYVVIPRKKYPRAYEPWNEAEKQLLNDALKHTNDVELLTRCFQRGEGAIISFGKKLIYERQSS